MADNSTTAIESTYVVRGDVSADAIATSLQALVPTRHRAIVRRRMTLLDTFDGRVRRVGARLARSEVNGTETITWQRRSTGAHLVLRLAEPVSFAWDLPHGPLHDAVAPVIDVRRLFAKAEVEIWGSLLDVLDDQSKTIARLRIESGTARLPTRRDAWRPLPTVITLTGLRGYEDIYDTLVPVIESRPGVEACAEAFDDVTLRELGTLPPPVAGPGADLVPTVLAETGARHIHHGLFRILTANEPGVRASLDSEFLHDFRVAVRRTRSLLGQIKRVFPPDPLAHYSAEFSWLGRLTGPPRDMDVLVLSLRAQQPDMAGAREALTACLGQAQQHEHRRLTEALDSDRYRRLLSDWEAFLGRSAPFHPDADLAGRLLVDVVSQRAWRLSRRIARSSETIDENTPADRLHELRLGAKKLRYLIDVTPSFYHAVDLERIVRALKKLQRVLGDFNDARVQERRLLACGRELTDGGGALDTALALEHLADQRRQRSERLRLQVVDGLARFSAHDTRSACRRAFKRAAVEERVP